MKLTSASIIDCIIEINLIFYEKFIRIHFINKLFIPSPLRIFVSNIPIYDEKKNSVILHGALKQLSLKVNKRKSGKTERVRKKIAFT